jgi:hypothetical protein
LELNYSKEFFPLTVILRVSYSSPIIVVFISIPIIALVGIIFIFKQFHPSWFETKKFLIPQKNLKKENSTI